MRIEKLFKVLVVGGTVLTAGIAGCVEAPRMDLAPGITETGATDSGLLRDDVRAAADVIARDQGVSSWMHWFDVPDQGVVDDAAAVAPIVDEGPPDTGTPDAAVSKGGDAAAADGVFTWLTWV